MKKILLIGIMGTYNYGCEAIVRGTVSIINSYDPSIRIYYGSYNYKDDCKRLKGCENLNILKFDRTTPKFMYHRIVRKLASYFGINYVFPIEYVKRIEKYDIDTIFSIGGDLYTISSKERYQNALITFLEKCIKSEKKVVLWGCSVGPFMNEKHIISYYKNHLDKNKLIVTRENSTFDYLNEINITSPVVLAPDPAFMVNGPIKKISNSIFTVGINLSPLSSISEYGEINKGILTQIETIKYILDNSNYNISLLPHVISNKVNDDDLRYLKNIYNILIQKYENRIMFSGNDRGFIGIKDEIIKCDIVIAARMHCAINAISSNVPVIFLSYSAKAKGMAKFIYGSSDMVIKLSQFADSHYILKSIQNWNYKSNFQKIKEFDYSRILSQL